MDTNSKNKEQESIKEENENRNEQDRTKDNGANENYYEINIEEGKEQLSELGDKEKDTQKDNGIKDVTKKTKYVPRTLIMFLIITLLGIIAVNSYVPIRDRIFDSALKQERYMETSYFNRSLTNLTSNLINKLYQELHKEYDTGYDSVIDVESIKYYIKDKSSSMTISNLDDGNITGSDMKKAKFYLHIQSDENAELTIEHTPGVSFGDYRIRELFGFTQELVSEEQKRVIKMELSIYNDMIYADKESVGNQYDEIQLTDQDNNVIEIINTNIKSHSNLHKKRYGNLDIIYMVNDDLLQYNDEIAYNMKRYIVERYYGLLIFAIGVISLFIMMIVAFLIPYSFQSKIPLFRAFNTLFLEFKIGVCLLIAIVIASIFEEWGYMIDESFIVNAIFNVNTYYYVMGITSAIVLFLFINLFVVYIKSIYHKGFVNGLIKNSLILRLILGFYNRLKQLLLIDIRRLSTRKIIFIALGSVFVLLMIAILPPEVAVFLALVVGGILLKYLLKLANDIRDIDDISNELAEGKFDMNIDESAGGILQPVTENLNHIKEGFSVAVDKATKSQKMKTELISNVSHDLKTPLTSIITYVDLLKDETLDDEKRKEYTDILDKMAKRLKVLIEDLFEASKASSGNIDIQLERLDINALFRQTLGELEEKLNKSSLIIRLNIPEQSIMCHLDGRRTYRVFENIMSNILKYAMKGSRVYIDMLDKEDEVTMVFRNISAYEMTFEVDEITERFTRGDESRHTEGSGLGLSIAKSLVELQRGSFGIHLDGDLFKLTITFPKDTL